MHGPATLNSRTVFTRCNLFAAPASMTAPANELARSKSPGSQVSSLTGARADLPVLKVCSTLYGRATVERKATPRPAQEGLQAGMSSPEIEPDREARRDQARAPFLNKVSPGAGFLADG